MNSKEFENLIATGGYRFLDFGTSHGSSIDYAYKAFKNSRPGLGIDIDSNKVDSAKSKGYEAVVFDILKIPDRKLVEFVSMSHFLEHLPSVKQAEAILRKAVAVSRRFVFIRQPFFDADGWLAQRGFKLYWSDWRGHPNKMTTLDFHLILSRMKAEGSIRGFSIHFYGEIASSDDSSVHPLASPVDQHAYDPRTHPVKTPAIAFDGIFKEIYAFILIADDGWSAFGNIRLDRTVCTVV